MDNCPICLENPDDQPWMSLSCGHLFHMKCFYGWKKHSKSCPNCRLPHTSLVSGWTKIVERFPANTIVPIFEKTKKGFRICYRYTNVRSDLAGQLDEDLHQHIIRLSCLIESVVSSWKLSRLPAEYLQEALDGGYVRRFRVDRLRHVRTIQFHHVREWSAEELSLFNKFMSIKEVNFAEDWLNLLTSGHDKDINFSWLDKMEDSDQHLNRIFECSMLFDKFCT